MISHRHKCIFIHIHKTAGSSIEHKLGWSDGFSVGETDSRTVRVIQPLGAKDSFSFCLKQFRQLEFRNGLRLGYRYFRPVISMADFESYFKFSFVRNSWSRAYSWYRYVTRHERHLKVQKLPPNIGFYDFLKHQQYQWGLMPQLDYLRSYNGNIPMDFIGRFEHLETDFNYVCESLGLEDTSLPRLLVSNNQHYAECYDQATIDLVHRMYREEIKWFGFEFGE